MKNLLIALALISFMSCQKKEDNKDKETLVALGMIEANGRVPYGVPEYIHAFDDNSIKTFISADDFYQFTPNASTIITYGIHDGILSISVDIDIPNQDRTFKYNYRFGSKDVNGIAKNGLFLKEVGKTDEYFFCAL